VSSNTTAALSSSASWVGGQPFLAGTACMSRSASSLAPVPRPGHAAERRLYAYAAVYFVGMALVLLEPLWGLVPNAYSASAMGILCGLTFYANPRNRGSCACERV
jgi:hypothetical protein